MDYQKSIEILLKERDKFIADKELMTQHFDGLINQLNSTIEILTGKKIKEVEEEFIYDDTNQR